MGLRFVAGSPNRLKLLVLVLVLVLALAAAGQAIYFNVLPVTRPAVVRAPSLPRSSNRLRQFAGEKTIPIRLHPMIELDGKTRAEVLAVRRRYVAEHQELVQGTYDPAPVVFGRIVDGRPWWGIEGLYYYGSGTKSIAGPSEESRHLANPFLLVGVIERWSYPLSETSWGQSGPRPFAPVATSLVWIVGREPRAEIHYDAKPFLAAMKELKLVNHHDSLFLETYNARDFGFEYLLIDGKRSRNITPEMAGEQPSRILAFLHRGPSCRYPGGCNNASPSDRTKVFRVKALPALMTVKLWTSQPQGIAQRADFTVMVTME